MDEAVATTSGTVNRVSLGVDMPADNSVISNIRYYKQLYCHWSH